MKFLNVQAFYLLLLIIPAVWLMLFGMSRKRALLSSFGQMHLINQFSKISTPKSKAVQIALISLALAFAVTALARPVLPRGLVQFKRGSVDLVAIIDVSKSMAAEDYALGKSRLDKAKSSFEPMLASLAGNRVGIVTFATEPFIQAELTEDMTALKFVLNNWVKLGSAPGSSTNLPLALKEALSLFDGPASDKFLFVLSDGGDGTTGELADVVAEANKKKIRILAAGMGSRTPSKIPIYDNKGKFDGWYSVNGQPATTSVNESTLKYLAANTGGRYAMVGPATDLKKLLFEPATVNDKEVPHHRELFQLFLSLSLLTLLAENIRERISA